jgi:hypothetical protein
MDEDQKLARERAEERLKFREKQKADAPVAMQEYRAEEEATRQRTQRLREERLAREKVPALDKSVTRKIKE